MLGIEQYLILLKPIMTTYKIPKRFRPVVRYKVAIIGVSDYIGGDLEKFIQIVDSCSEQIKSWGLVKPGLVSGGCSWADHIAVELFKTGKYGLNLHFPCSFTDKFEDNDKSHWAANPGKLLNKHHAKFSQLTGKDSLQELNLAIANGAVINTHGGFHARNTLVAKADYIIAVTAADIITGGTLDTWNKSDAVEERRMHIIAESKVVERE